MKDMIEVRSHATGERRAVRVSMIALVIAPTYSYRDGTIIKLSDKSEIEVRESYDQVWRMMDEATRHEEGE
jgi:hypothetical protein